MRILCRFPKALFMPTALQRWDARDVRLLPWHGVYVKKNRRKSRNWEEKIDRVSGEYLDILASMSIKENDLLNANLNYSGIVTESFAGIMHEVCPSVLKSEEGARPIFVANLETMVFGVYRQNMLRALLMEAKGDADCKYQMTYDKCLRARKEFYFKTFFLKSSTGIDK